MSIDKEYQLNCKEIILYSYQLSLKRWEIFINTPEVEKSETSKNLDDKKSSNFYAHHCNSRYTLNSLGWVIVL